MGEDSHYENFSRNRNAHRNGFEFTSLNMWTNMILRMWRNLLQGPFFLNFLETELFIFGDCFWCDIAPAEK
jgi:hypothetical protein